MGVLLVAGIVLAVLVLALRWGPLLEPIRQKPRPKVRGGKAV